MREARYPPGMRTKEQNLETIALFITQPVGIALSASFVMHAADAFFQTYQSQFKANVGGTMTYRCLYAAEGLAMVEIAEVIANRQDDPKSKDDRYPLALEVRGKSKLLNHRDMICHPMVVKWRNNKNANQAFADAGHKWNDVRAGLVWDVQKQINEALAAQGSKVHVDDVPITPEMGAMLRTILGSAGMSLTEEHSETVL